jgi:hypothetical protein
MPSRRDGRVEPGQPIKTAFSASAWNRAQDAADIVLGQRPGATVPPGDARSHALGKTSSSWAKGTAQNITLWAGTAGSEQATSDVLRAWNKFAAVPSGRWVMLARVGEHWYLIAAEC